MLERGFILFSAYGGLLGLLVLLSILVAKGRVRSFPLFTFFVVEEIFWTVGNLLYGLRPHSVTQPLFQRSMGMVDEVLQLFVFYELAKHLFCPTGKWAADVRKTFLWMMASCILIALGLGFVDHPAADSPLRLFILRSYFVSAVLMSELFVMATVLATSAGLPWKTHVARIAQGLGAYSLICVVFDLIISYTGVPHHHALYRKMFTLRYLIWFTCEVYWIVALWQEAPEPRELPEEIRMQIYSLNRRLEYDLGRLRLWRSG